MAYGSAARSRSRTFPATSSVVAVSSASTVTTVPVNPKPASRPPLPTPAERSGHRAVAVRALFLAEPRAASPVDRDQHHGEQQCPGGGDRCDQEGAGASVQVGEERSEERRV